MTVVRPAVKAIIMRGNKFLILKDRRYNLWTLPGGRLEISESPEDSLTREVFEETGLEIIVGEVAGTWNFRSFDGDEERVLTNFICKEIGGKFKLSNEDIEAKWVTPREFLMDELKVPHQSLKKAISSYFKI
ncbi:MAG: NUDIX domain-containing protein [Candidatus Aenigmarchaeota archaeon]|nr:NUDIX domain-containing protein [Candidatus Aenigmarchaeota archaeon]